MKIFLRYGSHAEKKYYENMVRFFDGVIFSANLLEASPAATVSLVSKFSGEKYKIPYLIDPMTYSFGDFYNYNLQAKKTDLEWIMSETKNKKLKIKRSYSNLAASLGGMFSSCIESKKSISIQALKKDSIIEPICEATIRYQKERLKNILKKDQEFAHFADDLPDPCMVFAPYFFIHPNEECAWLDVVEKITVASIKYESSLYIKLCFDKEMLLDDDLIKRVLDICRHQFKGVWLWINNFDENNVNREYLIKLAELVKEISRLGKEVFNRHGGFYSMILSKVGMSGLSNAVGYGEKKDIMPVLGKASPTVNYYYPMLYKKYGVLDIERLLSDLGIDSPSGFFDSICNCAICKGVIKNDINNFEKFGERYLATFESKKEVQTPEATEKSRYHYLICKVKEKKFVKSSSLKEIISKLERGLPISNLDIFKGRAKHIKKWLETFKELNIKN